MDTNITLNTIEEKRDYLRQMSNNVKPLIEQEMYDSVNEAVIDVYYRNTENTEFRTFNDWKAEGFSIVKGSKAFIVWGKPRVLTKKQEEQAAEEKEEGKEKEFFPIAFLFSNAQVEKKGAQNHA